MFLDAICSIDRVWGVLSVSLGIFTCQNRDARKVCHPAMLGEQHMQV